MCSICQDKDGQPTRTYWLKLAVLSHVGKLKKENKQGFKGEAGELFQ